MQAPSPYARLAIVALVAFTANQAALARSGGAPIAKTGAPGEGTCIDCHGGAPLNSGPGSLRLIGAPEAYTPGQDYSFLVELEETGMTRWGFELTALDDAHAAAGQVSAGAPDSAQVVSGGGKDYLTHTSTGNWRAVPDGPVGWVVDWTAPPAGTGEVTYWFAGNATNNNGETSGDHVYATAFTVAEAGADQTLNLMLSNVPQSASRGGPLRFRATIENPTAQVQRFDKAKLIASQAVPPTQLNLYSGNPIAIQPGQSINAPVAVNIPGVAPLGQYVIDVSIERLGSDIDTESFNLVVTN